MDNFLFLQSYEQPATKDIFFVWIPSVRTKVDLFKNLSKALNFPDYFGYNWDALLDLFLDLTWIEEKTIILIHESVSGLSPVDLNIYMKILEDSSKVWNDATEHVLVFLFCKDDKDEILKSRSNGSFY